MAASNSALLHVARNGQVFGQYRPELIPDLLESGEILAEDHVYDNERPAWITIQEWLNDQTLREEKKAAAEKKADEENADNDESEEEVSEETSSRSSRRSRGGRGRNNKPRKKNPAESALPGWIACLFAIGAAAGIWAWAQSVVQELRVSEDRVKSLSETVATLQRQNDLLQEMSPPGHVRGILTQEPMPGKVAIISGATIGLVKRSDVEAALQRIANATTPLTGEEFASLVSEVQQTLPSPLQVTLTDSSGRFELAVPDQGDYVIVSNAMKQSTSGPEQLFWLVAFASTDDPSPVMLMNEKNAISLRKPEFGISQPRALAN